MKYVILRDDDVNATTPISSIEPLYRPFLDRGLPVHLAIIPAVQMNILRLDGRRERFLYGPEVGRDVEKPIEDNPQLLEYIRYNSHYTPIVHGFNHSFVNGTFEFNCDNPKDVGLRLDQSLCLFGAAALGRPETFVAPQDQFSKAALVEILKRFRVFSTQYLNRHRLPYRYWPTYFCGKQLKSHRHLRLGASTILTHPGCLLSGAKSPVGMLENIQQSLRDGDVTVIVSHHWEYFFPNGTMNAALVEVLHAFADYLATAPDVRVIRMSEAHRYVR
jgi:Uncharacterized protein conserved in bacteria (DUF2334)